MKKLILLAILILAALLFAIYKPSAQSPQTDDAVPSNSDSIPKPSSSPAEIDAAVTENSEKEETSWSQQATECAGVADTELQQLSDFLQLLENSWGAPTKSTKMWENIHVQKTGGEQIRPVSRWHNQGSIAILQESRFPSSGSGPKLQGRGFALPHRGGQWVLADLPHRQ